MSTPALRIFDGLSDREMVQVPKTSAGATPIAIMSMILIGEVVYFSTLDSGTNATNWAGRVFSYDPVSGDMALVGTAFSSGEVPYALCFHMNRIWVGTNKGDGSAGKVYFLRLGVDTAWTTDHDMSTSSLGGVDSLCSYNGYLYVGSDNSDGNFAKVLQRDGLGAYTVSLTATGGTAKVNNGFLHMIVYNSNMYATYWNPDTTAVAKVYKYDGSSWTTPYTGSGTTLRPYIGQFVFNNTLYVLGGGDTLRASLVSFNGSSWTNLTAELPGTSTAVPIFGEVII